EILGDAQELSRVLRRRYAEKLEHGGEPPAHVADEVLVAQLVIPRRAERRAARPAAAHAIRPLLRGAQRRAAPRLLRRQHAVARVANQVHETRVGVEGREQRQLRHVGGRLVAPENLVPGAGRIGDLLLVYAVEESLQHTGPVLLLAQPVPTLPVPVHPAPPPLPEPARGTPRRAQCQNARVARSAAARRSKLARSPRSP